MGKTKGFLRGKSISFDGHTHTPASIGAAASNHTHTGLGTYTIKKLAEITVNGEKTATYQNVLLRYDLNYTNLKYIPPICVLGVARGQVNVPDNETFYIGDVDCVHIGNYPNRANGWTTYNLVCPYFIGTITGVNNNGYYEFMTTSSGGKSCSSVKLGFMAGTKTTSITLEFRNFYFGIFGIYSNLS